MPLKSHLELKGHDDEELDNPDIKNCDKYCYDTNLVKDNELFSKENEVNYETIKHSS